MLVLSRKEGQRILIGSDIEIVITQVCGNRVRVGITAPPEVPVHREEVRDRLQQVDNYQPIAELGSDGLQVGSVYHG